MLTISGNNSLLNFYYHFNDIGDSNVFLMKE